MRNNVLEKLALQDGNKEVLEKQVIANYKRLMNSFFEQKKLIPSNNYVEISYEDLVKELKTPRTTIDDNLVKLQKRKLIEKFSRNNGGRGRPLVFWKFKG